MTWSHKHPQDNTLPPELRRRHAVDRYVMATPAREGGVCMSIFGFSIFIGIGGALLSAAIVVLSFLLRSSSAGKA